MPSARRLPGITETAAYGTGRDPKLPKPAPEKPIKSHRIGRGACRIAGFELRFPPLARVLWRQDAGQPTLRAFDGHIARSKRDPSAAVRSAKEWSGLVFG